MKYASPAFCLVLAACLPGGSPAGRTTVTLSTQAAGGQLAYGAPTLAAAKRAFFGPGSPDDGGAGGGGSGTGGTGGGGDDLLGPGDSVTLHGPPPSVVQVTLTRTQPLGGDTVLRSSVMAGYQHLHGTLPDGFGVLTDPMDIRIWAQSLGAQVTLGRSVALTDNLRIDYDAGLGVTRLNAATHLQSALIDLRGSSHQVLPYAVAEARLSGQTGPTLSGSLWAFRPGAAELRLGLEQAF